MSARARQIWKFGSVLGDAIPGRGAVRPARLGMKVQQYCYFWIGSEVLPADEISDFLRMSPDRASVRGSRREVPTPVPVAHSWELRCVRHAPADEQAREILTRVEPVADKVRELVNRGDVNAGLMIVRYLNHPDGGYDALGWYLSSDEIALLARMGARIEADEYPGD